jgi:hypothetical protein
MPDTLTWEPPANAHALQHLAEQYQTAGMEEAATEFFAQAAALKGNKP